MAARHFAQLLKRSRVQIGRGRFIVEVMSSNMQADVDIDGLEVLL